MTSIMRLLIYLLGGFDMWKGVLLAVAEMFVKTFSNMASVASRRRRQRPNAARKSSNKAVTAGSDTGDVIRGVETSDDGHFKAKRK